jgi:hypothetical protein
MPGPFLFPGSARRGASQQARGRAADWEWSGAVSRPKRNQSPSSALACTGSQARARPMGTAKPRGMVAVPSPGAANAP